MEFGLLDPTQKGRYYSTSSGYLVGVWGPTWWIFKILWHENQLISALFEAGKSTDFSPFSWPENQLIWGNLMPVDSTDFYSFSWPKNQLNSARFLGFIISLLQLFFGLKIN